MTAHWVFALSPGSMELILTRPLIRGWEGGGVVVVVTEGYVGDCTLGVSSVTRINGVDLNPTTHQRVRGGGLPRVT